MEELYELFSQLYPLTQKDFELIQQHLRYRKYSKGERLLDFGQIERRTSFMISGIVQQVIMMEDDIFTIDISLSGMYFNNLKSFLEESPSIESQIALTDVEILYLEKASSEKLRLENHAFCYIYSKSWETVHLEREKRSYMLQHKNAYRRFEVFMCTNPKAERYLKVVPQKVIAEYLNLTPETFSRVKKEYFLKN